MSQKISTLILSHALACFAGGAFYYSHSQNPPAAKAQDNGPKLDVALPDAVTAAVQRYAPGKITSAKRGKEGGAAVYEMTVMNGEHKMEVTTLENGDLFSMEEKIEASALPAAVAARAKAIFGEGKIKAEKGVWGFYELAGKKDGKKIEILVNEGGEAYAEQAAGGDDDDDEKDEMKEKSEKK